MRRIIDGKRYDTEKAELIAEYINGYDRTNFHYYEESLYRTTRGAWFLVGCGGGRSPYRLSLGNNTWTWGETLIVMSPEDARLWLEDKHETEAIEEHFAEAIADA